MKILMVAASCSPYRGSEHYVGWSWLIAASRVVNHVRLLASNFDLEELERARAAGLLPVNVEIISAGDKVWPYSKKRFIARLQTWFRFRKYQLAAERVLQDGGILEGVDLVHQVTIATWRLGTPIIGLGVPAVWGPLGGGEKLLWHYAATLGSKSLFLEVMRSMSGRVAALQPKVRRAVRGAKVVIVTNGDTEGLLRRLGRTGVTIRCPMLVQHERFKKIALLGSHKPDPKKCLYIFSGGTLEGRKGVILCLQALAALKRQGVSFHFTFGHHGPDGPRCAALAERLGISPEVTWAPGLGGEEYLAELQRTHVFLFPSLRDNSPITLLEAMTARAVPIVLDNAGPGETVTAESGIVLPSTFPADTIRRLVDALLRLRNDDTLREKLGEGASRRVGEGYLDGRADGVLREAYDLAVSSSEASN